MYRETTHHPRRMRRFYPVAVLLILLAAIALSASLATSNANALPTFDKAVGGVGPCITCHTMATVHAVTSHIPLVCANCHPTGTAMPLPSKCAACHGGTSVIIAKTTHVATKCNTTPGCHGVPAPEQPTIAIDTVTPTTVKLKKTVALSGGVTPIDTAAQNVGWVVQLKKGSKWVQVKAGNATLGFLGGAMRFAFAYKPTKVGSYRANASFFNLMGGSKITSKWVLFKAIK